MYRNVSLSGTIISLDILPSYEVLLNILRTESIINYKYNLFLLN